MIEFSWGHILVIAVVALVVIGPKELPAVLRTAGQWIGKVRRMAAEFQGQFQEALREAKMADLKQHFDDISTAAKEIPHFDPVGTVRKQIEGAMADRPAERTESGATPPPAVPATEPPIATSPTGSDAAEASEPIRQPSDLVPADSPVRGPQPGQDDAHDKAEGRPS
jgi:sec-independent protein translocase protein TatB